MNARKAKMKVSQLSESSKAILCTKEKIEKAKKKILSVVESLMEDSVESSELIKACKNLSQSDYSDVIEERNIVGLCGYPLCPEQIHISPQKYHISCKLNKVYDITERKCFCSNTCFKASKYMQLQLSEEPVWLQEKPAKVTLLSDNANKGSAGAEVEFVDDRVSDKDVHPVVTKSSSFNSSQLLQEAVEECSSQLEGLIVSEKNGSFLNQSEDNIANISANAIENEEVATPDDYCESSVLKSYDDDEPFDSDDDFQDRAFPEFENENLPLHKSMPVVAHPKPRTSILIDPLPQRIVKPPVVVKNGIKLDFAKCVLNQWLTAASIKYLTGKDCDGSPSASSCSSTANREAAMARAQFLQMNYINLCKRLDRQEKEENEMDEKLLKASRLKKEKANNNLNKILEESNLPQLAESSNKIPVRKVPKKKKEKSQVEKTEKSAEFDHAEKNNPEEKSKRSVIFASVQKEHSDEKPKKSVSFASTENHDSKENLDDVSSKAAPLVPEPVIPLVDSVSQDILRQQIVSDRLKAVYKKLLPCVGIYYKSISDELRNLIVTLKLESNNVTHRPDQWRLLALVFFRMFIKKSSVECSDSEFQRLLVKATLPENISVCDIDTTIDSLFGQTELRNS